MTQQDARGSGGRAVNQAPRVIRALIAMAGLALLLTPAACRPKPPADIPGEFTFHGVAVHPAAVRALYRSTTGLLDLAEFETVFEARQWEDQFGWWVTEYDVDLATGRTPFFAYAAFAGPVDGGAELYVLSITFNEGEPSDIDNLILLQKSGSWLGLLRAWIEGSECSGGIHSERIEGDEFLYARDLTPMGLLSLSTGVPLDLVAHEDLEASIDSCVGSANFVYSLTEDLEDFVSVRLYDEPARDERGRTERYRYQSCFNRLYNGYLTQGKIALKPEDVDEFAARFRAECVVGAPATPEPPASVDK